jgi:hypothetical protein
MANEHVELKFTDRSKSLINNIQNLIAQANEGKKKWDAVKIKRLNILIGKLLDDPNDWVVCHPGPSEGELVLEPGYKLDLIKRVLDGSEVLPAERENNLLG